MITSVTNLSQENSFAWSIMPAMWVYSSSGHMAVTWPHVHGDLNNHIAGGVFVLKNFRSQKSTMKIKQYEIF